MANGVGKHKLLVIGPTEPWSVREKLCLATSVMKSGDQNWVSVSRAIKPFAEPGRPPDWFSQKHCASKYSELLESTEAPKRKRGERGEVVETVEDVIVRRLTAERIEELKKLIKETQENHRKLKREAELIQAGHLDSRLEELWEEILQKQKLEEEEAEMKRKNTDAAYQARQAVKNTPRRIPSITMSSPSACSSPGQEVPAGDQLECLTLDLPPIKPVNVTALSHPPERHPGSTENKETELSEEDVTVPYIGDELDLKTVGDIIAIIEDKADEAAEALDAAAVEAALSLCEENSHTLAGSWGTGPFQAQEPHPTMPAQSSAHHCSLEAGAEASLSSQYNSQDNSISVFPVELRSLPPPSSSSCNSNTLEEVIDPDECEEEEEEEEEEDEEDEEGDDGVEEFFSEPDGEAELEPAASESEDGYSLHTASSSLQLHTTADSIPSSPASSQFSMCSEDLEALQAHKIWKKAIMLVWRAAANHRYANVFLQPVTDEIAPGYHSIVHRPMDLATIKKNIETGLIRTTAEFQRDIMLMFQNAVMYNGLDHDVYHMALEMQRDVLEQVQQFLATQLIMETSESGISAKSLRGREGARRQDSTDKDTVSMSSPAFLLSLFVSNYFSIEARRFKATLNRFSTSLALALTRAK
uniref:Bromodomain-containing protein 8 n=1 Tax=Nothobranchius furzeri TaxID=105023 RepID=A0A8C6PSS3_NOTFU